MENLTELKNKIKVLAQEQVFLKNQRKTVKLQGERVMEPWQAFYKHRSNRSQLMSLYMEYGILKGRLPEQIQSNYKEYFSDDTINKLIDRYNAEVVRRSKE